MYRTNFVLLWLLANVGYYIAIKEVVDSSGSSAEVGDIRDSDAGYLADFSLYLMSLVIFRVFFAVIYIIKWKFRFNCSSKYKVRQFNMLNEVKNI